MPPPNRLVAPPRTAAPQRVLAFNPWLDGPTASLVAGVWLSDPSWQPPANGQPISSLQNQKRTGNPIAAGADRPTFRASTAAFNGRPTAEFFGAQVITYDMTDTAQPWQVVVVASIAGATGASEIAFGPGGNFARGIGDTAANLWLFNVGTMLTGSASDGNPHLFTGFANGAGSILRVDSAQTVGDAGLNSCQRFTIGCGHSTGVTFGNFMTGHVAFAAVYNAFIVFEPDAAARLIAGLQTFYKLP